MPHNKEAFSKNEGDVAQNKGILIIFCTKSSYNKQKTQIAQMHQQSLLNQS